MKFSVLLFPALLVGTGLSAQDTFHGDNARSGVFTCPAPQSIEKPAWVFKTGGAVLSSAVVAQGVAYFGSDDRTLYAVNLADGNLLWKFATAGKIRSTPAVADGVVYFGSYDGNVYALDAKSGEKIWQFATGGERHFEAKGLHGAKPSSQTIPDFWDLYASSPAVEDGMVYIGSGDGNLYALCAKTGKMLWSFATGNVVHSSPAVAGGVVYFGSFDSCLYAISAKEGCQLWKFQCGTDAQTHNREGVQSSPSVVDNTVYFGSRDFNFYALDAATGEMKWAHNITWSNASAAVADKKVYYGTSIPPFFVGLNAADGTEAVKIPMPLMVFSSPALAGGKAYVGSFDGCLYEIDLASGKVTASFRTAVSTADFGKVRNADGSINFGAIFHGDDYEEMYRSGRILFDLGAILASPTLADGTLLVGSCDGNLYSFR